MHKPIKINADPRTDGTSTNWLQSNEELLRFRAAMEISGDAIYLVDRGTMQFIDVNQTACERMGYTRDELLQMGPHDLLNAPREEIEREYDAVIAAGAGGLTRESSARAKDGRKSVTELQRRALRWGDTWVIVSIARDVTRRKRAERASRRIGRMYEILGATNEAILRASEPAQLFQRLCEVAVGNATLITAATVFVPGPNESRIAPVAAAGVDQPWIRERGVSVDASIPQGRGLVGTAFRAGETCVSNDCLTDERLLPWREDARTRQILAAAAVPLLKGGQPYGVMHFCANELGAFDDETVQLLNRMGENVSFALDNFEREHARERAEAALRAAEEQFRGLVEQSIAGIYIIQDHCFTYVNRRYAEIFGYKDSGELIGRDPYVVVSEKDRESVRGTILRQLEANAATVAFSFTGVRKDGTAIEAGAHGARATHRGRPAVIGLMQDISEKKRAEDQIKEYVAKLQNAFMSTVEMAMTLGEARDPYTAGHQRRVAEIAAAIGAALGFDQRRQEGLRVAGYLHDIGKMSVPAEILAKPGRLGEVEMALVRCHSQASYDILKNVEFPWPVAQAALQHHERLDGSGYPQGLKGEAILLEARILAVADVVEAMSTHRPYRAALGIDKALAEIERGRGSAYDPQAADACLALFREKGFRIPD